MDVTRLRVLAAVATSGSVTEAARRLHYSQPSVSHHLARLEAETGTRLTQRVGRGLRLTPDGEFLARRAVEIIGRVDSVADELAARTGLRAGRVRLASFQSALSTVVTSAATTMQESHPGVELEFVDAHPEVALELLRDGEVDAAIIFRYDDEQPADVRVTHLFDDPMYLLSRRRRQALADHRESPWIAGCEHCRPELVAACEAAGFSPRIAYTSDDVIVDQALVASGLGVTTMPGLAVSTYLAEGVHATEIPDFRRRVYVATYGEPPDPPATAAFVTALRQTVAGRSGRSPRSVDRPRRPPVY